VTLEAAMDRAMELARNGYGRVSPNPLVGCVILQGEEIIAEGWHDSFGGPHAEAHALSRLTHVPSDAVLVCTLEPCAHTGKTPPCADAIIASGIRHVVVGTVDPNPVVAGRGIDRMRAAGVRVDVGVREAECAWMNRFFLHSIQHRRPYCILKVAQSIDGCVATATGESEWITNEETRTRVHELRAGVDAVCVGSGTVRSDNPTLTVRLAQGRNPLRLVLDSRLSLSAEMNVFSGDAQTIVFCTHEGFDEQRASALRAQGVKVEQVDMNAGGMVDVWAAIQCAYDAYGVQSILFEAGSTLASALVAASIPHELHICIAPIIIGDGQRAFGGLHTSALSDAPGFRLHSSQRIQDDTYMVFTKKM
jgi:diaminohydroxyphosphoribosylaminopyrimidine deaminase/5-amino-6-(5-phosphoribosylamino)uracil reductase